MPAKKRKVRKSRKRISKKRINKTDFSLKVVLTAIIVTCIILIFFTSSQTNESPQIIIPSQVNNSTQMLIYPGSTVGIVTEDNDKKTYNYQAPVGITRDEIINYYKSEMVNKGWRLISSDNTQAVFKKGSESVRVWILYLDVQSGSVVDYIIDYSK